MFRVKKKSLKTRETIYSIRFKMNVNLILIVKFIKTLLLITFNCVIKSSEIQ